MNKNLSECVDVQMCKYNRMPYKLTVCEQLLQGIFPTSDKMRQNFLMNF